MLQVSVSITLGVLFVVIGAINVWLILEASARVRSSKAGSRLVAAHRVGGYIFIMLYLVMGYFMILRMRDSTGNTSPGGMVHMTIAMLLSPLLFIKVLIARYYKSYYNFLLPIGLLIFVLSFVLVAITAGPYLLRKANLRTVALEEINLNATIDTVQAAAVMRERCSTCHNLDRVVGARKDARGWLTTVNRMREMPAAQISEDEVKTIVLYLASQGPADQSKPEAKFAVAKALVAQRCSSCHTLDRVYRAAKTPAEWRDTVAEMIDKAQSDGTAGAFQPGEDRQIVDFLSATQTPEAVNKRKADADAASVAGVSVVIPKSASFSPSVADHGNPMYKTVFIPVACCLMMAVMMVRRPGRNSTTSDVTGTPAGISKAAAEPPKTSSAPANNSITVILQLVRITRQTHDAKTLRFAVTGNRLLLARPGQFLTFSFLFDGKKVLRSYSICSSPVATGYIEITPKRVDKGTVSVFLNDRAPLGLTVEASGPFGQFCFDEAKHKRIVLIAGGSGITPMMAMLRYVNDLNLQTPVVLLYSVRTERDIIFEQELAALKATIGDFQYHVVLSQPGAEWAGFKGRLSRQIIEQTVKDASQGDFFLCGPGPFMESTREILKSLGVMPGRIMQETFGGAPPPAARPDSTVSETVSTVEFVRSGRSCSIRQGQTLLQAAEEHGVAILSACRQGQCGTCKTRLVYGNVTMDAEQGLSPEAKEQGFVLTCVGHANGPVKLDA